MLWILFESVCLANSLQEAEPFPRVVHEFRIEESDAQPSSPRLAESVGQGVVRGQVFPIEVGETKVVTGELHSHFFDSYLILQDASGRVLIEDDNGLLDRHARLVVELEPGQYRWIACALRGGLGRATLKVYHGMPQQQTPSAYAASVFEDACAAVLAVEEEFGAPHSRTAVALNRAGFLGRRYGFYEEALPYFERGLEMCTELHGAGATETASSMSNLAALLLDLGQFQAALDWSQKALDIRLRRLGEEHELTALSLNTTAYILFASGQLKEAEPMFRRALELRTALLGADHPSTAITLNNLALVVDSAGRYSEAIPLFERSVAIREANAGPNSPQVATTLINLAQARQRAGLLAGNRSMLERSLQIHQDAYGEDHPVTTRIELGLGRHLLLRGLPKAAGHHLQRVVEVTARVLGQDHPDHAEALHALGMLALEGRDLEQARARIEEARAIRRHALGEDHPLLAQSCSALGRVMESLQRPDEAEALFTRAVRLRESALGDEHPSVAVSLHDLAAFRMEQGDFESAEPLLQRVIRIQEKNFGRLHSETASGLEARGHLHHYRGDLTAARRDAEEVLAIRQRVLPAGHAGIATAWHNLGMVQVDAGEWGAAEISLESALPILVASLGPGHPDVQQVHLGLAQCCEAGGRVDEARDHFRVALKNTLRYLDEQLPVLDEATRLNLIQREALVEGLLRSVIGLDPAGRKMDWLLFASWKGKSTRLAILSKSLAAASGDPEVQRVRAELVVACERVTALLQVHEAADSEALGLALSRRRSLAEELQQRLDLPGGTSTLEYDEAVSRLPSGSVLVDFHVGERVRAWLIGAEVPALCIDLGPSQVLRSAVEEHLKAVRSGALEVRGGRTLDSHDSEESQNHPSLAEILWAPLADAIGDCRTVFLSPDGFLAALPFATLLLDEGRFLIERHAFHYLGDAISGLEGLHPETVPTWQGADVIALGGVEYPIGGGWPRLPGTQLEIESLVKMGGPGPDWSILSGAVTAADLRAALPGQRLLHLATHAFFRPVEDHFQALSTASLVGEKRFRPEVSAQPGILSGLVLAGEGMQGPATWLTAAEIQELDLSACDLAVLSACETALGEIRGGEGMLGLRRAFRVAGADTVVSSLWQVEDLATARLMSLFYHGLLQEGLHAAEALHRARLTLLTEQRRQDRIQPATWGAFVSSGRWR